MKLADIIEDAANKYLAASPDDGLMSASCLAIQDAIEDYPAALAMAELEYRSLVQAMGLTPEAMEGGIPGRWFKTWKQRQDFRYQWLMFVALIVREENIEV